MRVDELDYPLPEALIAKHPPEQREAARLLVTARGRSSGFVHSTIAKLPELLPPSLFIFNDTRVIPARLSGQRPSGGRFELLLVERLSGTGSVERWLCMGRPLKSLREDMALSLGPLRIRMGKRSGENLVEVELSADEGVTQALTAVGELPLPPYLARAPEASDQTRYQTVFARHPGAVAAPTAGLHFGHTMLGALRSAGHQLRYVTLHVGPGTFAPLNVEELAQHPMHEEAYDVPSGTSEAVARAKREGRLVVAVGTTVVRTLEASAQLHGELRDGPGRTRICIYPPNDFRVIDALVTNFHLPRSTLLALVMAFAGVETTRAAYAAAIAARYRFFSYGDAMLIAKAEQLALDVL